MNNLNLKQMGVQELNAVEIKETDGGHMVGYSKWYHEQKAKESTLDMLIDFFAYSFAQALS